MPTQAMATKIPPFPRATKRIGMEERNIPNTGINPRMNTINARVRVYGKAPIHAT